MWFPLRVLISFLRVLHVLGAIPSYPSCTDEPARGNRTAGSVQRGARNQAATAPERAGTRESRTSAVIS